MKIFLLPFYLLISLGLHAQKNLPDLDNTFTAFQSAIINSNGDEAVIYLDSNSMNYFKSILDNVLNADSLTLESLPLSDKFNVLV